MPQNELIDRLRAAAPAVLPSLLLCDFANLGREVERLEQAGVAALHLDVMDGHFVPNLSYGLPLVETFRRLTRLPLDVHLMISNPGELIEEFVKAGADILTIHVEAAPQPGELLRRIRGLGAAAGLAFNPSTPVSAVQDYAAQCDLLLAMSVNPGFGGQAFEPVALKKLRQLKQLGHHALLEVDGGVNAETIADCAATGAELFVAGSAIFRSEDYTTSVHHLTQLAADAA